MNVDDLLDLERPLTDEEYAFLEAETMKKMLRLQEVVEEICAQAGEDEPELAARLRSSMTGMLTSFAEGAAIPLHDLEIEDD